VVYAYIDAERVTLSPQHSEFLTEAQVWDCIEPGTAGALSKITQMHEVQVMERSYGGRKSTMSMNMQLRKFDAMFPLVTPRALRDVIKRFASKGGGLLSASEYLANDAASTELADYDKRCTRAAVRTPLTADELFKTAEEKDACRGLLLNTFPKLWASQINAIVKETNYTYYQSALQLREIQKKTGRGWFEWLKRPQASVDERHLEKDVNRLRALDDAVVAQRLNGEVYETLREEIDCACCFGGYPFEELYACHNGHLFCANCMQNYVKVSESECPPYPCYHPYKICTIWLHPFIRVLAKSVQY
jgi:hypothetical protein